MSASACSAPCTQGGTAIFASTWKLMSTEGPPFVPETKSADDVCTAGPSYVIVQVSKGSMQRNAKPPAPRTVARPSRSRVGSDGPLDRSRYTRPSGKATLSWMSWVSQFAPTASISV